MTLTLDLTPEQEDLLLWLARLSGRSIDEFARVLLLVHARQVEKSYQQAEADAAANPIPLGESVYDAMKDYIGKFQSDGETTWSENTGEKFTEYLLEKQRRSRL